MYSNTAKDRGDNVKNKREAWGQKKRQSDAIVVGIMVIVKTADKKIRD